MKKSSYVGVLVEAMQIAFPLREVERVVRAVAVHPVPRTGGCLLGTIDVAGDLLPLYDLRRMFGVPSRPLQADDRMLLLRAPVRCALLVDGVTGTVEADAPSLTGEFGLHAAGLRGVVRTDEGVLLVHEPRLLLAMEHAMPLAERHG